MTPVKPQPYQSPYVTDYAFGTEWLEPDPLENPKVGIDIRLNFKHAIELRDELLKIDSILARDLYDKLEFIIAACTPT